MDDYINKKNIISKFWKIIFYFESRLITIKIINILTIIIVKIKKIHILKLYQVMLINTFDISKYGQCLNLPCYHNWKAYIKNCVFFF